MAAAGAYASLTAGDELANGGLAPIADRHEAPGHPGRGFALTAHISPAIRRALPSAAPAQFVLRAAFLAATGVLFVAWLAAA